MGPQKDVTGIEDIKLIVDDFYDKVRKDELLAPVFLQRIPGDWQPHLNKMYLFWNAVIFGDKGYVGNPFSKHVTLPVSTIHFEKWLSLFNETIDEHFKGKVADDMKQRASIMGAHFLHRLLSIKDDGIKVIV